MTKVKGTWEDVSGTSISLKWAKWVYASPEGRILVFITDEHDGSVFFFQAEDGIRDLTVTGVQTCALPICRAAAWLRRAAGTNHSTQTPRRRGAGPAGSTCSSIARRHR